MKSKKSGTRFFSKSQSVEILNCSAFGMWLLVNEKEYFIDYEDYPDFNNATINELRDVRLSPLMTGLHWPKLDMDVELEALDFPERYPLVAKNSPSKRKRKVA